LCVTYNAAIPSRNGRKEQTEKSTRKREIQNAITYTAHTNKGERERDI
jgi:hypothetical protein